MFRRLWWEFQDDPISFVWFAVLLGLNVWLVVLFVITLWKEVLHG